MLGSQVSYQQKQLNKNPDNKIVRLMCLRDGSVLDMLDDGPFPVMNGQNVEGWSTKPPGIGRQRILSLIKKRDADGLPLYVALVDGVRIWDPAITEFREVPVMTPKLEAAHKAHLAVRDEAAAYGRRELERRKAEAAAESTAKTKEAAASAVGELAAMLKGALVPEPKKNRNTAQEG